MTIREFYKLSNSNFDIAIQRFASEARIEKYLSMFLKDSSMTTARKCLDDENYEDAFRAIHNLKGVCLNLALDWLTEAVVNLCEELRPLKYTDNIEALYGLALTRYDSVIELLKEIYG